MIRVEAEKNVYPAHMRVERHYAGAIARFPAYCSRTPHRGCLLPSKDGVHLFSSVSPDLEICFVKLLCIDRIPTVASKTCLLQVFGITMSRRKSARNTDTWSVCETKYTLGTATSASTHFCDIAPTGATTVLKGESVWTRSDHC